MEKDGGVEGEGRRSGGWVGNEGRRCGGWVNKSDGRNIDGNGR